MKCIIPGNNVKVFGRTIHCLSKIGEDLYIEPLDHGLALRTVNSSRSAYACFTFAPTFFYIYDDGRVLNSSQQIQDEDSAFKCKITMKSCLSVFKSLSTIEKTVEKCKIKLNNSDSRLTFTLYCKHGITKTYNLTYQETESLQAVFSKDLCPNKLVAQSRLLCDAVSNFQTSQEEISIIVSPERVSLKNYVDDEPDPTRVMHTEMCLLPEEFEDYTIGIDTEVTFCLKELRAILSFADSCGLQISVIFEMLGKPIVFCLDGEGVFEASFVLATLAEPSSTQNSAQQHQQQQQQSSISTSTQKTVQRHRTKETPIQARQQNKKPDNRSESSIKEIHRGTKPFQNRTTDLSKPSTSNTRKGAGDAKQSDETNRFLPKWNSGKEDVVARRPRDVVDEGDDNSNASSESFTFQGPVRQQDRGTKTVESVRSTTTTDKQDKPSSDTVGDLDQTTSDVDMPSDDDNDNEFEFIPSTPPAKKFKSIFFGSSQSQNTSQQVNIKPAVVLAEDTDEESD
ncbi:cell cycle checkpoint control protein RAD9A-like isoform X2 [Glandiceps talaboti]